MNGHQELGKFQVSLEPIAIEKQINHASINTFNTNNTVDFRIF